VTTYFNSVGLLVYHGAMDAETVASIMGGSLINAWRSLAGYVYDERAERGDDPNYYGYFEHVAALVHDIGPQKLARALELRKFPPGKTAQLLDFKGSRIN